MDQTSSSETTSKKTCPNETCKFDNSQKDANFCILCGTLLYRRCDSCLDMNPRYAKFCYYCGTPLEDLRDEAISDEELPEPELHPESDFDEEHVESASRRPPEDVSEADDDNWPGEA